MKINLTLKTLLIGLVVISVLVVLALALTNIYSNTKLFKSQNQLTELVLPLERATQELEAVLIAFVIRQQRITASKTLKEIEQVAERESLEQAFQEKWDLLNQLSVKVASASQPIRQLATIYQQFLDKDQQFLESAKKNLALDNLVTDKLEQLNQVETDLQINAEAISGKINFAMMRKQFAIRKSLETQDQSLELPHDAIIEFFQQDLTQTQRACHALRIAVSSLSAYGHQLLLVREPENLSHMKANQIAQSIRVIKNSVNFLKNTLKGSSELQPIMQKIAENFSRFKLILIEADDSLIALQTQKLLEQNHINSLKKSLNDQIISINDQLKKLQFALQDISGLATQAAGQAKQFVEKIIFIVSVIAILYMLVISTLIAQRIIVPIKRAVVFAHTISTGDFTAKIKLNYKDELSHLFSELSFMVNNLNSLVGQVQRSGVQVTSSATELAATAKQQKTTMLNQVKSTNQVEKSVEEISQVAAELASTMQQVASLSTEAAEFANHARSNLSRMEGAVQNMETASKSISRRLSAINDKTENITSVVTTITKVADQTNLLSLNAAIEAEKAGEYGRGFNVVAREIRRLADQTAVATLDIEYQVKEMQSAVSAGVMEMDKFIAEVRQSAEDIGKTSTQLSLIIEKVQTLSPRFEEVNVAMETQSQNVRQINHAMMEVSEGMRQTAESLEESFFAIEQLNEAARGLQDEVARFKVKN